MKIQILTPIIYLIVLIALPHPGISQTGEWKTVTNTGIIHRHECSFAELNGKFYLIGGRKLGVDKYTNIYDPGSGSWTKGINKSPIELHHFQAAVYKNKLYIIGAFTGNYPDETPVGEIYIYNPSDDSWAVGGIIPSERRRGAAGSIVYNNKIYIIGGATNGHQGGNVAWLDEYDPETDSWKILSDAPHERDHYQAATAGNKLFLAGGRKTSLSTGHLNDLVVKEVDAYDFDSNSWETYPNTIPTGRGGTASAILNNELLVIGGEGPASPSLAHKETEAFDLNTKTWRSLALLDTGRHATHALNYNNKIYIVSGSKSKGGSSSSELNSMEEFSLSISPTNDLSMPGEINFGKLIFNETKTESISIINSTENNNISITNIYLDNNSGNEFSIINAPNFPYVLASGSTLILNIKFDAVTAGVKTATLVVENSGTNNPKSASISGESVSDVSAVITKELFQSIIIYPNPAKSQVIIDKISTEINWELISLAGIKLLSGKSTNDRESFDVNNLNPGIYILKLVTKNGDLGRSLLVKKE